MPLQAPNLDDRTFAQIVSEAKTLIPRYAPEWTDHNESDPGITLVQLFAWMTEMLLYRVNRIPDRNYIAFLRLLGIELLPARPASAELTFTLARKDTDVVLVPKGTQVAAATEGDQRPRRTPRRDSRSIRWARARAKTPRSTSASIPRCRSPRSR